MLCDSEYWKQQRQEYQQRLAKYDQERQQRPQHPQRQSAVCIGNRDNRLTAGAYQDPPRPAWLPDLRNLEQRIAEQDKRIAELEAIIVNQKIDKWRRITDKFKQP